jgi:hypothetical protein
MPFAPISCSENFYMKASQTPRRQAQIITRRHFVVQFGVLTKVKESLIAPIQATHTFA